MTDLNSNFPFSRVETELDPSPTRAGRHRARQQQLQDRRRSLLAFIVVVAVFAGLGFGGWWGYGQIKGAFSPDDYPGPGSGRVTVIIEPGQTATDIGNTLVKADVVASTAAFIEAANEDPTSRGLQPGTYVLRKKMKARDALALLLDPANKVVKRFTIPEGKSVKQTLKLISDQAGMPIADLEDAVQRPSELGVPAWAKSKPTDGHPLLEGFLFPATYDLQPGATAKAVLSQMVTKALAVMHESQFEERAKRHNLSLREALIVASLIEGEGIPSDFTKISRVVYNRLQAQMPLQYDSTTNYGRELHGQPRKPRPSYEELRDPNNPYSTHLNQGLPPGPISNPGKAAVEAAVEPSAGPWLYFVRIDTKGNSAFATTLPEHEANIQRAKKNGAFQ